MRGKAPIPVKDEAGHLHLIMAKVDVDEKTLQAIADETGGKFYRATDTDSLQKIYEQINRFEKSAQTVQKFEHVEELYPWALIPALAILGLGLAPAAHSIAEIAVRFTNPWWLPAGLCCGVLVVLDVAHRYDARQHAALARFVSAHLRRQLTRSISLGKRRVQRGPVLAALAFVCLRRLPAR